MAKGTNAELLEKLESHALRVRSIQDYCTNEEQTKVSLINPYLEHLGFDVRDPRYVQLEYRSDIGSGTERVDYALLKNGIPALLIEAKPATMELPQEATTQLRRYAMALEKLRYCAITNGVRWHWYAKSQQSGDLNPRPFLVHDATNPNETEVRWLASLRHDPQEWDSIAIEQDLQTKIAEWFTKQRSKPEDDFIVSIVRGVNERNNQKTREIVSRIWVKTIALYNRQEIEKALRRASKPEQSEIDVDIPSKLQDKDVDTKTIEKAQAGSGTIDFVTNDGVVQLGVGLRRAAWRIVGEENWSITSNMSVLCKEVLLNLAKLHDHGIDEFFAVVQRGLSDDKQKSRWIQNSSDLSLNQLRFYTELTPEWRFHVNANNTIKFERLQTIASYCISEGKPVALNDYFEIWDPQIST